MLLTMENLGIKKIKDYAKVLGVPYEFAEAIANGKAQVKKELEDKYNKKMEENMLDLRQVEGTKVISTAIHKGGAGKTSNTVNIGYTLSKRGYRVLLMDADSQINLTMSFIVKLEEAENKSIYKSLIEKEDIRNNIIHTQFPNLDIVPGDIRMAEIEAIMSTKSYREEMVAEMIKPLLDLDMYDFIFIDNAPTLGNMVSSVLNASDYVISPLEPSYYGVLGIGIFMNKFKEIQRHNKKLKFLGVLLSKQNKRTNISSDTLKFIDKVFPNLRFDTMISVDTNIPTSQWQRKPLEVYSKHSSAVKDFNNLADEILKKLEIERED